MVRILIAMSLACSIAACATSPTQKDASQTDKTNQSQQQKQNQMIQGLRSMQAGMEMTESAQQGLWEAERQQDYYSGAARPPQR